MDITISGVKKSFDDVQALQPIDLKIKHGKFTTLLGPSGCGKTTLLRMVAGLETPDAGEIHYGEECIFSAKGQINKPVHRRKVGMVFQDFALWPHMTVFENIAFSLRANGHTKTLIEDVLHALEVVRLNDKEARYPHQLSGGQQQRVAFARAIVNQPEIVLFDEPLSALDAALREEMRIELMILVRMMGLTALYVTHDQIEAMSMSDEMIVMNQGEILQKGSPQEIYSAPTHPFVAGFIGKANWLEKDTKLIRPEHVHFEQRDSNDVMWAATVKNVSYLGDRYEIRLDLGDLGEWTAYSEQGKIVGEKLSVYISRLDIHQLSKSTQQNEKKLLEV